MRHHRVLRSLCATLLLAGLSLGGRSPATAVAAPESGTAQLASGATAAVCVGIPNCRLVGHADVDSDGRLDQIGWHQLSSKAVQVRVLTDTGTLMTARVDVRLWWGGGAWAGAARVDHHIGVELLVGSMQGAHTPMYTMLTDRSGALVVEDSPSPLSPLWQVDAAAGDDLGWWRHTTADGHTAMTQKIAVRIGTGDRFRGRNVTYVWRTDRWVRTTTTRTTYPSEKQAAVIAGFHVPGLARFPGVPRP